MAKLRETMFAAEAHGAGRSRAGRAESSGTSAPAEGTSLGAFVTDAPLALASGLWA